jgi:zinc transport system substrate-binding protein
MKIKIRLGIAASILVTLLFLFISCARPSADIVAGSSLIANIIEDVADGRLKTCTLVPPEMCPGHYDIKPGDIEILTAGKALVIHNWQENMKNVTGAIEAANNPNLIVRVINIEGNWMAPPVQSEAVDEIAQALAELDRENSAYYQRRAEERKEAILSKSEEIQNRLQQMNVSVVKVICDVQQAGFVSWAGFDVVATYGRPEELSVAEVEKLVGQAKQSGVALVIDNLQSGATATSEAMARDIGAVQVTISNFPGGFKDTETWEKAMDKNVDLLLESLAKWRKQRG